MDKCDCESQKPSPAGKRDYRSQKPPSTGKRSGEPQKPSSTDQELWQSQVASSRGIRALAISIDLLPRIKSCADLKSLPPTEQELWRSQATSLDGERLLASQELPGVNQILRGSDFGAQRRGGLLASFWYSRLHIGGGLTMNQTIDGTWVRHLHSETRSALNLSRSVADVRVPGLTILGHPDSRRVGERVTLPELRSGKDMLLSRLEPLFATPGEDLRRPLADPFLSRRPARLAAGPDRGVRLEPADGKTFLAADGAPVDRGREVSAEALEQGVVLELAERVVLLLHLVSPSPPRGVPRFGMVGESPAFVQMCQQISRIASLDAPVLLRGETGSGKELVASALHQASPRRSNPYLAVNVGAIPASLAAAELFGAARGAFTGAERQRAGYFARADSGTLLLDEVGETSPEVQVLLLRVLEDGEIHAMGSEKLRQVDVRVIAATDADLEAKIEAGTFRAPLLHRLSAHQIHVPPLRRRRDDIGRLLIYFLRQELKAVNDEPRLLDADPETTPWLPAPLIARLATYTWPGNVRQLRNIARHMVASSRDRQQARLEPRMEEMLNPAPPEARGEESAAPIKKTAAKTYRPAYDVGEDELLEALRANRFKLQPTAAQLGISRTALYSLIDNSPKVRKPRDLEREEIERCRQRCGGNIETMVEELEVSRKGLRRRMTALGMP